MRIYVKVRCAVTAVAVLACASLGTIITTTTALAQSRSATQAFNTQQNRAEALQRRRENFESGRRMLKQKGVPFDPDELLKDDWPKRLKNSLDSLPEWHKVRREPATSMAFILRTRCICRRQ
jgi:cytochrome c5